MAGIDFVSFSIKSESKIKIESIIHAILFAFYSIALLRDFYHLAYYLHLFVEICYRNESFQAGKYR